jgi:hypothetical protein
VRGGAATGKLTVATNFGRQFDADIKRFRFTSSLVYDLSAGVEILTPLFPKQFLLLATLANIGKSIGVTTANVVRAPIQMSFSLKVSLLPPSHPAPAASCELNMVTERGLS